MIDRALVVHKQLEKESWFFTIGVSNTNLTVYTNREITEEEAKKIPFGARVVNVAN
jgi:hypothetical protein